MLTKIVGPTGLFSLSPTTGTFTATSVQTGDLLGNGPGQTLPARKVRIAVTQPACIAFGTGTNLANNNSDVLMPAGHVEHFTLDATQTVQYVLVDGGTTGTISITAVA